MRAYASHYAQGGSEKYGNKVGGYMHQMQGIDVAVYIHPCVLYRGQDLYSMLAVSELALRLSF